MDHVHADMAGSRKKRRAARAHDGGGDPETPPEDPTMQLVQYQPQQNDFTKPFLNMLQREGNPYVSLPGDGKVGSHDWHVSCFLPSCHTALLLGHDVC